MKKISFTDMEYPKSMRGIEKPPQTLYCIGDTSLLNEPSIAVVGSRKCSEYGKQVAMKIGKTAAQNGLTVVSGMAKGIDNFAHLGALMGNGKTIAVLGSGVDICYPRENRKLYDRIKENGLLISQFPPGTEPRPFTFPLRNRTIAALAEATIVVEAETNSGALITAEQAAILGKSVFAVPGNITSAYSLGCNKLLADGAMPVAVIDDIFYGIGVRPKLSTEEEEKLGQNERVVYALVKEQGETTVDFLCRTLGKDPIYINGILGVLEIKGLVAYNLGKIFIAKL